eukprot:COSAG05_NODE_3494_length_2027_cov_1.570539_1_plen_72_part_00
MTAAQQNKYPSPPDDKPTVNAHRISKDDAHKLNFMSLGKKELLALVEVMGGKASERLGKEQIAEVLKGVMV